jgi:hypothetical protein
VHAPDVLVEGQRGASDHGDHAPGRSCDTSHQVTTNTSDHQRSLKPKRPFPDIEACPFGPFSSPIGLVDRDGRCARYTRTASTVAFYGRVLLAGCAAESAPPAASTSTARPPPRTSGPPRPASGCKVVNRQPRQSVRM